MKAVYIYNPHSGKGRKVKRINYIVNSLKNDYEVFDVIETKTREETITSASNACGKYDVLIFSGGDGTFNNILNGIGEKENAPILGYIPMGTINDLAHNLNIPCNYKKAIKCIKNQNINTFDIGKINNDYFGYVCAAGSFTNISYKTNQKLKKILGAYGYYFYGFLELFKIKYINVDLLIDGEEYHEKTALVFVLNSKNVGGFKINKDSDCNDGLFDVFIIKPGFNKGVFNFIRFFGFHRGKNRIIHKKAKEIKVSIAENPNWCVDGEEGNRGFTIIKVCDTKAKIYTN